MGNMNDGINHSRMGWNAFLISCGCFVIQTYINCFLYTIVPFPVIKLPIRAGNDLLNNRGGWCLKSKFILDTTLFYAVLMAFIAVIALRNTAPTFSTGWLRIASLTAINS